MNIFFFLGILIFKWKYGVNSVEVEVQLAPYIFLAQLPDCQL